MLLGLFFFVPIAAAAPTESFPYSSDNTVLVSRGAKYKTEKTVEIARGEEQKVQPRDSVIERIALCESQNNALAKNPRSTASGRFQFLKGSWKYYGEMKWGSLEGRDVFDYEDNTELAYWVAENYGLSPWYASKHCWG